MVERLAEEQKARKSRPRRASDGECEDLRGSSGNWNRAVDGDEGFGMNFEVNQNAARSVGFVLIRDSNCLYHLSTFYHSSLFP